MGVAQGVVFLTAGAQFTVARWLDAEGVGKGSGERLSRREGRWALSRVFTVGPIPELRDAYRALLPELARVRAEMDVDRMRETLLDAAERGDLVVFETRLRGYGIGHAVEAEEAPAPAAAAPKEDTTWIEIVLMDDEEPPKPVAFASYKVELPDGATRTGMLDAKGRARLEGIDPGSCKVSFPKYDKRDWKAA